MQKYLDFSERGQEETVVFSTCTLSVPLKFQPDLIESSVLSLPAG